MEEPQAEPQVNGNTLIWVADYAKTSPIWRKDRRDADHYYGIGASGLGQKNEDVFGPLQNTMITYFIESSTVNLGQNNNSHVAVGTSNAEHEDNGR
jgi:hypothetical protein